MVARDECLAVVDRYVDAFSEGDKGAYLALFTDDATVEDPVGTDVHQGREAIAAFWDGVRSLSPVIRLVPTGPVRVAGRELAFPMQAISTIGDDKVVVDIIDVFTITDDGHIPSMRAFCDSADTRPYEG